MTPTEPTPILRSSRIGAGAAGIAAFSLLLFTAACSSPTDDAAPASASSQAPAPQTEASVPTTPQAQVATLSFPADWLVERLGAGRIEHRLVMPRGEQPATWRPSVEAIMELQQADLLVMNGAGYEAWTDQASLPISKLLDTSADLDLVEIQGRTHSHGAGGEHSHVGFSPETWMDPDLYFQQARQLHGALVEVDPDGTQAYDAALATLGDELTSLSAEVETTVAPLRGMRWVADHPSFAYFARRFDLEIEVLDFDAQAPPTAETLASLEKLRGQSTLLLLTASPHPELQGRLGDGPTHLVIDPLEQPAGERYDYLGQMRANLVKLTEVAASLVPATR